MIQTVLVPLPPRSKSPVPLEKCLEDLSNPVQYEGDRCAHCNGPAVPLTHQTLWALPRVLVLQLKRFRQTGAREKVETPVAFPEILDMRPFCEGAVAHKYRLFAVVDHSGTADSGHYTATRRIAGSNNDRPWVMCNDCFVNPTSPPCDQPSNTAHILVYEPDATIS